MIADHERLGPLRTPQIVAGGLALLTLVIGAINITRSFGYDEAVTYANFINEGSPRRALTTQVVFNNHPMFSLFQAILWRVGFVGEAAQRLAPIACGAATVGIVAHEVTRRCTAIAGAVAGMILMVNPLFLPLYRSVRGYALATLAVLLAGLLIRTSWHDRRRRWLVLQALCMVIAVTTHAYSAVTLLAVAVAALVLGRVERRHLVTWSTAAVAALIIMWPVLDDARANARARGNRYQPDFLRQSVEFVLGRNVWAVVLIGAALVAGMVVLGRQSLRVAAAVAAAGLVVFAAILFVWQILQPFDLYSRFFVSIVPFLAILAGIGISLLPRLFGLAAGIVIVFALVPGARDTVDAASTIRDTAALVDRARDAGYDVCGQGTEALVVYTAPLPFSNGLPDDDCDVLITVFGVTAEQADTAMTTYGGRTSLGGSMTLWAPPDIQQEIGAAS